MGKRRFDNCYFDGYIPSGKTMLELDREIARLTELSKSLNTWKDPKDDNGVYSIFLYEMELWDSIRNRNRETFTQLVDEWAVFAFDGKRLLGTEYTEISQSFDYESITFLTYDVVNESEDIIQTLYSMEFNPKKETYFFSSTWRLINGDWRLAFMMDQKN